MEWFCKVNSYSCSLSCQILHGVPPFHSSSVPCLENSAVHSFSNIPLRLFLFSRLCHTTLPNCPVCVFSFWTLTVRSLCPPFTHTGTMQSEIIIFYLYCCFPLPHFCCGIPPYPGEVLPYGNDCNLQCTLDITSTPFGVFRPSSFCCASHFTTWAYVLKSQGLGFATELG